MNQRNQSDGGAAAAAHAGPEVTTSAGAEATLGPPMGWSAKISFDCKPDCDVTARINFGADGPGANAGAGVGMTMGRDSGGNLGVKDVHAYGNVGAGNVSGEMRLAVDTQSGGVSLQTERCVGEAVGPVQVKHCATDTLGQWNNSPGGQEGGGAQVGPCENALGGGAEPAPAPQMPDRADNGGGSSGGHDHGIESFIHDHHRESFMMSDIRPSRGFDGGHDFGFAGSVA
jgi:hypothetical protein